MPIDRGGPYHLASNGSRGAAASRNGKSLENLSLEERFAVLETNNARARQKRHAAPVRPSPSSSRSTGDSEGEEDDPGLNAEVAHREQDLSDEEPVSRVARINHAQRTPPMRGSVALGSFVEPLERERSESHPSTRAANQQRVPAMHGSVARASAARVVKSGLKKRQGITDEPLVTRYPPKVSSRAPARELLRVQEGEPDLSAEDVLLPAPPANLPVAVMPAAKSSLHTTAPPPNLPVAVMPAAKSSLHTPAPPPNLAVASVPAEKPRLRKPTPPPSVPPVDVVPAAKSKLQKALCKPETSERKVEASSSQCPEGSRETAAESGELVPADIPKFATVTINGFCDLRITDLHDWPDFFEDMCVDLKKTCTRFGDVVHVSVDEKATDGRAWIRFAAPEQARACSEAMDRIWFGGRCITVELCSPQGADTKAMPLATLEAMVEDDI